MMLQASATLGNVDAIAEWHDRMVAAGVAPSTGTFALVLASCARARRAADAEAWLNKMEGYNVPTDMDCYSAADAEAWLNKMEGYNVPTDMDCYSSAIEACCKANDVERSLRVFEKLKKDGFRAETSVYASLALLHSRRGDWKTIERLTSEMRDEDVQMNDVFFKAALNAYSGSKRPDLAERLFREGIAQGLDA